MCALVSVRVSVRVCVFVRVYLCVCVCLCLCDGLLVTIIMSQIVPTLGVYFYRSDYLWLDS